MKGDPIRETQKLLVKLKLLTDTYIRQSKRVNFSETEKSSLCKLCNTEIEDLEYFLLNCEILESVRNRILDCIDQLLTDCIGRPSFSENPENKLNLIFNVNSTEISSIVSTDVRENIEFNTRRLRGALHVERFKLLQRNGITGIQGLNNDRTIHSVLQLMKL